MSGYLNTIWNLILQGVGWGAGHHQAEYPPIKIREHDSLYFDDGNVVLLSLPKDYTSTAFKVHTAILMHHSRVFASLFSAPSSPSLEVYDNVPFVHLRDEAVQLTPFLEAIYDPAAIPSKRDFYFSFDKVESTFKLCKKFQCNQLFKGMQKTLSSIWPKDLASWDRVWDGEREDGEPQEDYVLRSTLPEPCSSIHLARDYDVPEILPAAFYYLFCTLSIFFKGISLSRERPGIPLDPAPNLSRISKDDHVRCIQDGFAIYWFMRRVYSTALAASCAEELCRRQITDRMRNHINNPDKLFLLDTRRPMNMDLKLCEECMGKYRDLLNERRLTLWNTLPDIFKLEEAE